MIVLDASAWVDVLAGVVPPPDAAEPVVVPPHFDAQVVGALRALTQRGSLSTLEAQTALQLHLQVDFTSQREEADILQAWRWQESMSLTDAWYAALALRLSATWVTTDRRAAAAARALGVKVDLLA